MVINKFIRITVDRKHAKILVALPRCMAMQGKTEASPLVMHVKRRQIAWQFCLYIIKIYFTVMVNTITYISIGGNYTVELLTICMKFWTRYFFVGQ